MSSADMEDNDILDSHQHGLTQRKSYLTNLLELLEDWANTLDGRHKLDFFFFYFRDASDTVPTRD